MIDYGEAHVQKGMAEAENVAVVRRLFDFVKSRGVTENFAERWAEYSSLYAPDLVIHEAPSLPYGGDYSGPDALERHAQAFQGAWDRVQQDSERDLQPQFFASGDKVVVLWSLRGRNQLGETFEMPATSVYRLKDGRVTESRMFTFDSAAIGAFLSADATADS